MAFLLTILLALATFRITRVITRDKLPLIDVPREAFVQRWGAFQETQRMPVIYETRRVWIVRAWRFFWAHEFEAVNPQYRTSLMMKSAAYLWECDWCMSIWVGAGVVYTTAQFVEVPYPYLQWLAAAALTGLIAQREKP
jgi:hypothetical protein